MYELIQNCLFENDFLKSLYERLRKKERGRETHRENLPPIGVIPQMAATTLPGPGQSWEPGAASGSQALQSCLATFPGA